eukprot:Sspe_Gene.116423::Locus_105652_Transcript_1_1_Confidence_1.000_Length_741::g.116423::m.116423
MPGQDMPSWAPVAAHLIFAIAVGALCAASLYSEWERLVVAHPGMGSFHEHHHLRTLREVGGLCGGTAYLITGLLIVLLVGDIATSLVHALCRRYAAMAHAFPAVVGILLLICTLFFRLVVDLPGKRDDPLSSGFLAASGAALLAVVQAVVHMCLLRRLKHTERVPPQDVVVMGLVLETCGDVHNMASKAEPVTV